MRISDWSSDVCSSDLVAGLEAGRGVHRPRRAVSLVEGRVAALADAGGEFAVARRAQGEAPALEVPVGAQGDLVAREALLDPALLVAAHAVERDRKSVV